MQGQARIAVLIYPKTGVRIALMLEQFQMHEYGSPDSLFPTVEFSADEAETFAGLLIQKAQAVRELIKKTA